MAISLLSIFLSFFIATTAIAQPIKGFNDYMYVWNEKIELATQHLKDAEAEFLNGDALQGCVEQRKAANFGIQATEALIKAFEISGSTNDLSDVRSGLSKWKELRDFCG